MDQLCQGGSIKLVSFLNIPCIAYMFMCDNKTQAWPGYLHFSV